jgi:hypothetical protein
MENFEVGKSLLSAAERAATTSMTVSLTCLSDSRAGSTVSREGRFAEGEGIDTQEDVSEDGFRGSFANSLEDLFFLPAARLNLAHPESDSAGLMRMKTQTVKNRMPPMMIPSTVSCFEGAVFELGLLPRARSLLPVLDELRDF